MDSIDFVADSIYQDWNNDNDSNNEFSDENGRLTDLNFSTLFKKNVKQTSSILKSPEMKEVNNCINSWNNSNTETLAYNSLTELVKSLESISLSIIENQKNSKESRKNLSLNTKAFSALNKVDESSTSRKKEFGLLLKSYQKEIDKLTSRALYAESEFLSVFEFLNKRKDPVIILKNISKLILEFFENNNNLIEKSEYDALRAELDDLENQDVRVKELELQLANSSVSQEALTNKLVAERIAESKSLLDSRDERLVAELENSTIELEKLRTELANTKNNFDMQLREYIKTQESLETDIRARDAQIDIQRQEIENLKMNISTVVPSESIDSKEKEKLINSIDNLTRSKTVLEIEVAKLEGSLEESQNTINRLKSNIKIINDSSSNYKESMEKENSNYREEISNLKKQLSQVPKIQEIERIKKELDIFHQMEFASIYEENENEESLELMLMKKMRKLENDFGSVKIDLEESKMKLKATLEELRNKESEIERLRDRQVSAGLSMSLPNTPNKLKLKDPKNVDNASSENLLTAISNQRDRLKVQVSDLEQALENSKEKFSTTQVAFERLKADNVKLYEKIRYLEAYSTTAKSNIRKVHSMKSKAVDFESQYEKIYENRIDPFGDFKKMEKQKKLSSMNSAERAAYNAGLIFLKSKHGRLFLIGYIILLHFLVFFTSFSMARDDHEYLIKQSCIVDE